MYQPTSRNQSSMRVSRLAKKFHVNTRVLTELNKGDFDFEKGRSSSTYYYEQVIQKKSNPKTKKDKIVRSLTDWQQNLLLLIRVALIFLKWGWTKFLWNSTPTILNHHKSQGRPRNNTIKRKRNCSFFGIFNFRIMFEFDFVYIIAYYVFIF